jgi:hypothetical protein
MWEEVTPNSPPFSFVEVTSLRYTAAVLQLRAEPLILLSNRIVLGAKVLSTACHIRIDSLMA